MNVTATVTAVTDAGNFFMQDTAAPWGGIYVNTRLCEFVHTSCVLSDGELVIPVLNLPSNLSWVRRSLVMHF